jgi:heme-degrading monooxygenase HmoA
VIAVLFEVWPAAGKMQHYLDLAAALKEELSQLDGFISVERFESLSEPGKLLSLSFFRDEEAVTLWRNTAHHRATQTKGRSGVFSDYRLRVAHVMRDYGMTDRAQAPDDSRIAHERRKLQNRNQPLSECSRSLKRN